MTKKLGVVMDPIAHINYKKDSTLAMLWEAQDRQYEIYYFEQKDLFLKDGHAFGNAHLLKIFRNEKKFYEFGKAKQIALAELEIILMRKDPPFDSEFLYSTFFLEMAELAGTIVVNKPQSLRDANEKLFTSWFPQCCPPALVTRDISLLRKFLAEHKDIICKPIDAMAGYGIFRLTEKDLNASVVFEMLTHRETTTMMAQKYIPAIKKGDKRILLIHGEPIPYALARIPKTGELRGNLAAGAKGVVQPLSDRDYWICQQLGPLLREKGLYFVGIDVIGDYLTEINVTSPTCIREIDKGATLNIAATLFDHL